MRHARRLLDVDRSFRSEFEGLSPLNCDRYPFCIPNQRKDPSRE